MFDLFLEGNKYYEYPSFQVALYSLLLALTLSSIMAFTYKLTYDGEHFSKNMFQAMILSSLVTSMIMMAVGNNLAVGFGIMGAVAIIRFRTNVQNPRNIIFMFGALSIGITTGVYGYAVSVAGTVTFCLTAFLLNFSNYKVIDIDTYEMECAVTSEEMLEVARQALLTLCSKVELQDLRNRTEKSDKCAFQIKLKLGVSIEEVFMKLKSIEGLEELRIGKRKFIEQL